MPFFKELATAAGSSYVNEAMVAKFQRELVVLKIDELELTKRAQEIRARVAERDLLLEELERLYPFESTLRSMAALNGLQTQDLKEAAEILVMVMKKKTRQDELKAFIEGLRALPY